MHTVVVMNDIFRPVPDGNEFYCDLLSAEVTDILRRITVHPSRLSSPTETPGMVHDAPRETNTFLMAHSSEKKHAVVRPARSIREAQNRGAAVLLDIGQGTCYSMNPAGTLIWQLLRLNYSTEQIVHSLATRFGADHDRIREDVIEYTEDLRRNGLIIMRATAQTRKLIPRLKSAIRRLFSTIASRHAHQRKP
jgi:Coenzyme PQQ synthesis protein D (PqqD)